jgi:hypothetical protein
MHVTGNGSDTLKATIYMEPLIESALEISPSSLMLNILDSASLTCRLLFTNGAFASAPADLEWTSLSPLIADVSEFGKVTTKDRTGLVKIICYSSSLSLADTINVNVVLLSTVSLAAIADAYVQDAEFSGTNYGSNNSLIVWTTQWSYDRRAYVKFDVSDLICKNIQSASFSLNVTGTNTTSSINLAVFNVASAWVESTITWSNSPTWGAPIDTAVIFAQSDIRYNWDLTKWMKDHPLDSVVNLCIVQPTNEPFNVSFASREHATVSRRPKLSVVYADTIGSVGAASPGEVLENSLEIEGSNPFNPVCNIGLNLVHDADVTVSIFNMAGKVIKQLVNETKAAGSYRILWNGRSQAGEAVSSGMYLVRLSVNGKVQLKRIVLLK